MNKKISVVLFCFVLLLSGCSKKEATTDELWTSLNDSVYQLDAGITLTASIREFNDEEDLSNQLKVQKELIEKNKEVLEKDYKKTENIEKINEFNDFAIKYLTSLDTKESTTESLKKEFDLLITKLKKVVDNVFDGRELEDEIRNQIVQGTKAIPLDIDNSKKVYKENDSPIEVAGKTIPFARVTPAASKAGFVIADKDGKFKIKVDLPKEANKIIYYSDEEKASLSLKVEKTYRTQNLFKDSDDYFSSNSGVIYYTLNDDTKVALEKYKVEQEEKSKKIKADNEKREKEAAKLQAALEESRNKMKAAQSDNPMGATVTIPNLNITLNSVELTSNRNQFDDTNPNNVVVAKLTIENTSPVGTHTAWANNIKVLDGNGKLGKLYPLNNDVVKLGAGEKTDLEVTYGVETLGKLKLKYSLPDSPADYANFTFDLN